MGKSDVDYAILFRQLAVLPAEYGTNPDVDSARLVSPLRDAFYKSLGNDVQELWANWLRQWLKALSAEGSLEDAGERMKQVNPKYILKEHLLVDAYKAAMSGDYALVHELYTLIQKPYDEQPCLEAKYYRRAPDAALSTSGTSVMT